MLSTGKVYPLKIKEGVDIKTNISVQKSLSLIRDEKNIPKTEVVKMNNMIYNS